MKSLVPNVVLLFLYFLPTAIYAQGGATCQTAVAVGAGTHTSNNSLGDQWYAYTNGTSSTVLVRISSCTLTSEDTWFSVTKTCGTVGFAGSDDECDSQSADTFEVQPSETVYIIWSDQYTSATYQWELSLVPVVAGDLCSLPSNITLGTNTINQPGKPQWYTYTNTSGAEKIISFVGVPSSYVALYSDCDQGISSGYLRQDYLIAPGESILAVWSNATTWTFEVRSPGSGDKCSLAKPAVLGLNVPTYYRDVQWFSYTNTSGMTKVVEATIEEFNLLSVYDDCSDPLPLDWTFENLSYITAPGQTLYFLCGYTEGLTLSIRDIEAGDYCSNPKVGHEGLNFNDNLGLDVWYSYTNATAQNQDIHVATNESNFIRVYEACNASPVQTVEYDFYQTVGPGQTIYFQMEKTKIYSIDIGNELIGDQCTNPITAHYGINYPSKVQEDQWFTYTNSTSQSSFIKIDNNGTIINPIPNDFSLLESCSDPVDPLDGAYSGVVELFAGNTMLIHWDNVSSWTMSDYIPAQGEFCSLAKNAQIGMNQSNSANGNQWYKYKNETSASQSVEITSCGLSDEDTYVHLYNACNGALIEESDDYCGSRSRVTHTVLPGETIYFNWSDDYTSEAYDWQLVVDGVTSIESGGILNFSVYPTISNGEYNFSEEVTSVEVYTVLGALVKKATNVSAVNISGASQGMYWMKVNVKDKSATYKVVKE